MKRSKAHSVWASRCGCATLVPGLTDHFDEIEQLAAFARDLGNVERVDVPQARRVQVEGMRPPSRELTDRVRAVFRDQRLTVA